jgi:hypothetical protein
MKKLLISAILVLPILAFAQEKSGGKIKTTTVTTEVVEEDIKSNNIFNRKHELKLGGVKLLSGGIFEATYEYIYSKDFTFGSSILLNFDSTNDYPEDFSLTPFARFYFQETKEFGAKGFFVEGFAKYISGQYDPYLFGSSQNLKYNVASIGLGLGKKWINRSGFVFEPMIGVGRNIGQPSGAPDASFRGDLYIGYRF